MTVRHLPLPAFSSIHLSHPQAIASRLTVDGGRGPLETGGIGHVARDVICLELELVRRAVGEASSQGGEELVQFMPPVRIAPGAQHAHRLGAGPQRLTRSRVTV